MTRRPISLTPAASARDYVAGRTRRTVTDPAGPLRHAATNRIAARVRDTGSRLAVCGTAVVYAVTDDNGHPVMFDPDHPRACHRCASALRPFAHAERRAFP